MKNFRSGSPYPFEAFQNQILSIEDSYGVATVNRNDPDFARIMQGCKSRPNLLINGTSFTLEDHSIIVWNGHVQRFYYYASREEFARYSEEAQQNISDKIDARREKMLQGLTPEAIEELDNNVYFCSAIGKQIMVEPTMIRGQTTSCYYERHEIEYWVYKHCTNPGNNMPCSMADIIPAQRIKDAISKEISAARKKSSIASKYKSKKPNI